MSYLLLSFEGKPRNALGLADRFHSIALPALTALIGFILAFALFQQLDIVSTGNLRSLTLHHPL